MEEELAWETHGCESRCRGRVDMVGARGPRGIPRSQRAAQGEAGPSHGHLGLCGPPRASL